MYIKTIVVYILYLITPSNTSYSITLLKSIYIKYFT